MAASSRRQIFSLLLCCAALALLSSALLDVARLAHAATTAAQSVPLRPFAYATANSSAGYNIIISDGVSEDRRVARVQVDSVYFADTTARLSTGAGHVAVRITGDRYGGSSLYNIDVATGEFVQVALAKNSTEGIGAYQWSPAGNTLAYVRSAPALDPALMDNAYGTIYIYSVGFEAVRLGSSNGSDRLLGFTDDGLGVYVARRETTEGATLEHLVYLPLTGRTATKLIQSHPELKYSNFALFTSPTMPPRVAFVAEGDFALAAQNSNVKSFVPVVRTRVKVISKADVEERLSRPTGMGLITSDTMGMNQTLIRRDVEDYTHLSWAPDGSALLAGGRQGSWRVALDGTLTALGTSVSSLRQVAQSDAGTYVTLTDNPTTRLVTLDHSTGKVSATKYVGIEPEGEGAQVWLDVPYIHQVNDTAGSANGNWACGPTSVVMALAYYGKLDPWAAYQQRLLPDPQSQPVIPAEPTGADYAPYVTNEYTLNGNTYRATAGDPSGNQIAGLYGTICPTGLASWPIMMQVLEQHGLTSQRIGVTWDSIVAALDRRHPVLLGNRLTSEGHILLVKGYTADGNLIVNDPYGNKFAPGYGVNDGNSISYPWKRVTPRTALEIIGVYPPPPPTPMPPTSTPIPPTETAVPAIATATTTATETPMLPTATLQPNTPTPLPPTATPSPTVTATSTPTATATPSLESVTKSTPTAEPGKPITPTP